LSLLFKTTVPNSKLPLSGVSTYICRFFFWDLLLD
jgi:hypothetical protein